MPQATTGGTAGYTPPFAWQDGDAEPAATWRPYADRFALAILNAEILLLDQGSPLTADGGMFDQEELLACNGPGLACILRQCRCQYPDAFPLLDAALRSTRCGDCPSPHDWNRIYDKIAGPIVKPPSLNDVEGVNPNAFRDTLRKVRPPKPLWQVPSLAHVPLEPIVCPAGHALTVSLPPDPWSS